MTSYKFKDQSRYGDRIILGSIVFATLALVYLGVSASLAAMPDWTYVLVCLGGTLLFGGGFYLLNRTRMKLSINDKRIKFKVKPFHKKAQRISWSEVEDCQVVRTSEQEQWHGANQHRPGEVFISLVGRNGLSLRTRNGRRYFIGCQDVDGLEMALKG